MMDRPILMSAPMVLATLREVEAPGTGKTQTRRILKVLNSLMLAAAELDGGKCLLELARFKKGDRLWIRETWCTGKSLDEHSPAKIAILCQEAGYRRPWCPVKYEADGATVNAGTLADLGGEWGKTRVAIHMPRWASRLTLTVTDVRVQRLQEISEADAIAEGIKRESVECADGVTRALWLGVPHCGVEDPVAAYSHLWESINNPRGLCAEDAPKGWAANPWIVAVTFNPEKRNIDQ